MAQIKKTLTLTNNQVAAIIDALLMYECVRPGDWADRVHQRQDGVTSLLALAPLCDRWEQLRAATPMPALQKWVVLYTRIPTNYNPQQKLVVEAATEADAREIVREHIGDRGKQLSTYAIEDTKPYEPLAVAGRVIGGAS